MNHFEAYSKKATTIASRHPTPLIGPIKTRREAMAVYPQLVAGMKDQPSPAALQAYLDTIEPQLLQFHAELDFFWIGDGADFRGLDREIEDAFEAAEAAQFFKFRASESGAGRIAGNLEQGTGQ